MWDDRSLLNIDFSIICSAYTLQDINQLEKQVRPPRPQLHTHTHTFARPCHPHRPPCPRPRGCPTCRVARLRRQFLELIDFNVSITASLYASYYFELRTLCEKAERGFTFKPLSEAQQRKLELNSGSRRKELKVSKRWKSRDSSDR